jgi:predicted MFS family arabinose efflux permease
MGTPPISLGATMPSSLLIASAATSGFTIGFVPTLVDSIRAPLGRQVAAPERRVNRILTLFYLCWVPAMPLSGWLLDHGLLDHARHKEILFFGLLSCVLGIAWLGMAHTSWSLLSSVLVLGVGYSMVATAGIALMPVALGFTAEPSNVGALNIGFVFVALGAVAGTWLVNQAVRRWGHRQGLLYLSLGLVVVAGLVFLVPRDRFLEHKTDVAWSAVFGNIRLGLLAAIVLLYFAVENCLEVWPEPFLKDLRYKGRALTVALLIFWGAFTLVRVATGWLPDSMGVPWILLGLLLVSGFTMGNLSAANEYSSGTIGFWLVAVCYGPLLPGFLALVMSLVPDCPGTALGIMLALGGLDTLVVRPWVTSLARRRPVRNVMRVPMLLALLMAAPLLVLALLALLPIL